MIDHRIPVFTGAAAAVAITIACSSDPVAVFCTEEFRFYTVTALDDARNPVPDLAIRRTNVRTGAVLEPGWLGLLEPGVYLVVDDGLRDEFSDGGDTLRVTGESGSATFTASFVFAVPEPGRCHVEKLAGPDTVTVEGTPP